jgi:putative oxidoreductase
MTRRTSFWIAPCRAAVPTVAARFRSECRSDLSLACLELLNAVPPLSGVEIQNSFLNMKSVIDFFSKAYLLLASLLNYLQSPILLLVRVYFFWQLMLTGFGKLTNLGKVTEYFASLGLPMPALNAFFIGSLECFGSVLLMIGLASRPFSLLILIAMVVAYLVTPDIDTVKQLFVLPPHPHHFFKAAPFPFLLAAVIVLVFGPGKISLDTFAKKLIQGTTPDRTK